MPPLPACSRPASAAPCSQPRLGSGGWPWPPAATTGVSPASPWGDRQLRAARASCQLLTYTQDRAWRAWPWMGRGRPVIQSLGLHCLGGTAGGRSGRWGLGGCLGKVGEWASGQGGEGGQVGGWAGRSGGQKVGHQAIVHLSEGLAVQVCLAPVCRQDAMGGVGQRGEERSCNARIAGFNGPRHCPDKRDRGWALCGHDTPAGAAHADCSLAAGPEEVELPTADDANADIGESRSMTGSEAWDPQRSLPRSTRMDVGAKAKLLIDRARLVWLCHRLGLQPPPTGSDDTQAPAHLMWGSSTASGRCARLVQYVPSTVTGENKLLLCSLRI
ncbi:uncharacterized protein HaLaN_04119 [Haematococcus lacustris]|uniref:Uncharacterized protein n=1 Tax=Haematococcus lacustris TaxID=44745 RepID=A0A699YMG3_HAELA|nr:uncharacterized protein HaLaN_04119 [Haematococcus lacustris]